MRLTRSALHRYVPQFLRGVVATVVAGLLSALMVILLGGVMPIAIMMLIYGRSAVQDAPAHGGVILFLTLPLSIVGVLIFFPIAVVYGYKKLSKNAT